MDYFRGSEGVPGDWEGRGFELCPGHLPQRPQGKLAAWEAEDQAAARAEYRALVGNDLDHQDARRYKELTAAFTAGDREAFEAAKESGLAELHAPEGVDEPTDGEEAQ